MKLVAFDSCDQLLTDLRGAARKSVGPWGLPSNASTGIPEAMLRDGREARAATGSGTRSMAIADAPAFSGTNVHEQGVDEPDVVKTDGRRIVTVDRGVLRVVDAATRALTGQLSLGASATGPADLLIAGDRALVLVRGGFARLNEAAVDRVALPPDHGTPQLLLVDLAGTPRVISRYRGDGMLIDARQTGTVARVVLGTAPKIAFPYTARTDEALLRENRKAIDAAKVDAWLPSYEITTGGQTTRGKLDCAAVSRPTSYSGAGMLTVLTFDLNAPALTDGSPVAVVADGETVYGNGSSLYVANNQRWLYQAGRSAPSVNTEIYKFTLPPVGKPVYAAGGTVPGELLNQYSMSEWDGHLRVATTNGTKSVSSVRILRERDGDLVRVGEVGGLGKGEQIYSVRFIGPRGYVVTFRQTDPLYSLDLADPAKPRVTGELKITGYSAHLQPAGDGRLIGIGQEATDQGMRIGSQVSLFDVAGADPRRLDQHVVPGTVSDAEWDPHAVLWWPATNLLVVPLKGGLTGALALRVTGDTLQPAGELALPVEGSAITRTLVIGDELWSLTGEGLLASSLSTLDRREWVSFG
jgi:hypothetical protein